MSMASVVVVRLSLPATLSKLNRKWFKQTDLNALLAVEFCIDSSTSHSLTTPMDPLSGRVH